MPIYCITEKVQSPKIGVVGAKGGGILGENNKNSIVCDIFVTDYRQNHISVDTQLYWIYSLILNTYDTF